MSIVSLLILFIFSAFAQNPSSFSMAYQTSVNCLKDVTTLEERKNCYSICEKSRVTREDSLACSRLKRDAEKSFFNEKYEVEESKELQNFQGLAQLECKLLNLTKRDEVEMNECIAEQYMKREEELLLSSKI